MANEDVLELLVAANKLSSLPEQHDSSASPESVSKYGLTFNTKADHKSFQMVIHYLSLQTESDGIPMVPIRDIVVDLLKWRKAKGDGIVQADVASYIKACRSVKPSPHYVVRELHGVQLRKHEVPFEFGDFTIYQWDLHKEILKKMAGPAEAQDWPKDSYKHLIGCSVQARNVQQARELADQQFTKFENVFRFMNGAFKSNYDVTVVAPHRVSIENSFVFNVDYNSVQTNTVGFVQDLPIDDPCFSDPNRGYDKLLGFLHTPKNDLQGKIVRSIEWIGQAFHDRIPTSAMVKAATALEVLLSYREPGPITPGIMAQISETLAFLLADSPEAAVKLEKDVRDLYDIRSKIVHFGKHNVEQKDLIRLMRLVSHAILVLLTHPEYSKLQTMEAIAKELKLRKYASTRNPDESAPAATQPQIEGLLEDES